MSHGDDWLNVTLDWPVDELRDDAGPAGQPVRARASVIVPVRDRRDLLARLLEALESQVYRDFEVVLVDDGSSDDSGDLAAASMVAGRPVRVLRRPPAGGAAARQAGAAMAEGEVLAFTDSDCQPDPNWLQVGVAAVDDGADVVAGRTLSDPPASLEHGDWNSLDGLYATCNVFYRRSAFLAVGGFDNEAARRFGFRLTPWARSRGFGENTLLGCEVARRGPARYAPDAIVIRHASPEGFREFVTRSWILVAFPALLREVPEIRPAFVRRGLLLGTRSRVPAYATVAAALLRRRRLAGLALLSWAGLRIWETRNAPLSWAERFRMLPKEMAADAVQSAALIVGSVKAKTVTL